ncbi:putative RNA-binding protein Luc7-like 1 isoform X2 [Oratosquilla oratoria]|uniref:putative RNA-binding protein Luc7-like 1 isoform X2 n=1 Tax=Oratosquilla oratoria TaxID=337810 RepID=UPI003F776727
MTCGFDCDHSGVFPESSCTLVGHAGCETSRLEVRFTDAKVCKSFLLGCCPHEILSSTRMDLGDCPKIHDLALRADYEKASKTKDFYYDIDAMEHLQSFITDCDRRTEQAKKRLAETQEELSAEVAAKANKVHDLAEQIGKKLAKAEQLGADGMVEESMKLMEEVEDLRKRKAGAEQEYRNSMPASSYQQQKLRVCEVCSAYLGIHDNDRRLADHFGGKLHLGFIKIREKLEELKKTVESRREKRREEREAERNARFGEIADYDITRDRERERERYREERERRDRDRDRERDRDRDRYRDERDRRRRHTRSRSRSRDRRSRRRSRSSDRRRSRSRERSRRERRSRSRDRHSRSHDRSRSRERSSRDRTSRSREEDRRLPNEPEYKGEARGSPENGEISDERSREPGERD